MSNWPKDIKTIVYFAKLVGHNIYKIGHSRDLQSTKYRITAIRSYSPFDIKLIGYNIYENAIPKEKEFHKKLERFRIKNEWFKIPDENINNIYIYINKKTDYFLSYLDSIDYITPIKNSECIDVTH